MHTDLAAAIGQAAAMRPSSAVEKSLDCKVSADADRGSSASNVSVQHCLLVPTDRALTQLDCVAVSAKLGLKAAAAAAAAVRVRAGSEEFASLAIVTKSHLI